MNLSHIARQLIRLGLTLVVAAIAAAPAWAGHQDLGPQPALELARHQQPALRPEDRAGIQVGPSPTAFRPGREGGLDWRDAGVGAATTLAMVLVTVTLAQAVRSRRRISSG